MSDKKTCFVIQPFSQPYEIRYETIYKPAIEKAGLTPRRVGKAGDNIITEEIERGIRNAVACFAEITPKFYTMPDIGGKIITYMHNPNVWYELGFAYACGKPVSMICNQEVLPLSKLPFDISTRYVNGYTNSVDANKHARMGLIEEIAEDLKKKTEESSSKLRAPSPQDKKSGAGINDFDGQVLKILVEIHLQITSALNGLTADMDIIHELENKLNYVPALAAGMPRFHEPKTMAGAAKSVQFNEESALVGATALADIAADIYQPKKYSVKNIRLSLKILQKNKYVAQKHSTLYENYFPTDKAYQWYRDNYGGK